MPDNDEISVGDLVVGLEGDSAGFVNTINQSLDLLTKLETRVNAVGTAIDALNARPILPQSNAVVIMPNAASAAPVPAQIAVAPAANPAVQSATTVTPAVSTTQSATASAASPAATSATTATSAIQITQIAVDAILAAAQQTLHTSVTAMGSAMNQTTAAAARTAVSTKDAAVNETQLAINAMERAAQNHADVMGEFNHISGGAPGVTIPRGGFDHVETLKEMRNREIEEQNAAGGDEHGGGGGGEHGGMSHYMMRRIGFHVGQAAGISGLGNELTLLPVLVEAFGPAGLVVAGALAMATVYQKTVALREAAIAYNNELRQTIGHWADIAHQQVSTTSAGASTQAEITAARDQIQKITEDYEQSQRGLTARMGRGLDIMVHGGLEHSNTQEENTATQFKIYDQQNILDAARKLDGELRQIQLGRVATENKLATDAANVAAMHEGPAKRQMEMENHIATERLRIVNDFADKRTIAQSKLDQINNTTAPYGLSDEADSRFRSDQEAAAKSASQDLINIQIDQTTALSMADVKADAERRGNQRRVAEETLSDANELASAMIGTYSTGYDRELATLQESNRQKVQEYIMAGRATETILKTNAAREQTIINDHIYAVGMKYQDLIDRMAAATMAVPSMEIAWAKMSRELVHDLGMSGTELEKFHAAFMAASHAEADHPLLQSIKGLNIDLAVAARSMTALAADSARLHLAHANDGTSNDLIEQQAQTQMLVRGTDFARTQLESIHNTRGMVMQMQDYVRSLREAVAAGLSLADAQELFNRKSSDIGLSSRIDPGTFQNGWRSGGDLGKNIDIKSVDMGIRGATVESKFDPKTGELVEIVRDLYHHVLLQERLK